MAEVGKMGYKLVWKVYTSSNICKYEYTSRYGTLIYFKNLETAHVVFFTLSRANEPEPFFTLFFSF